jgi:adenylate cyclase class 2
LSSRGRELGVNLDLDFAIFDADRIAADLDARVVGPGAVGEAKAPGVPGAGDDAVLDIAAAERGAHVRTNIVNGEILSVVVKDREEFARNLDGSTFSLGQIFRPAHGLELRHEPSAPQNRLDHDGLACHDSSGRRVRTHQGFAMLEIEMKFPVADVAGLLQRIAGLGAQPEAPVQEADHYFNAPDRDFAKTDEALRLRRIGESNFVTYKGPKIDKQTKTRKEIEVPLGHGAVNAERFCDLLVHLGYKPVAVVRKRRRPYRLERDGFALEICLDEVEQVGRFAELEIVASEDKLEAARNTLMKLAGELGLSQSERRSYLEMLLQARGEQTP